MGRRSAENGAARLSVSGPSQSASKLVYPGCGYLAPSRHRILSVECLLSSLIAAHHLAVDQAGSHLEVVPEFCHWAFTSPSPGIRAGFDANQAERRAIRFVSTAGQLVIRAGSFATSTRVYWGFTLLVLDRPRRDRPRFTTDKLFSHVGECQARCGRAFRAV